MIIMALPIFLKGLSEKKNVQAGFYLEFEAPADTQKIFLKVAGRTFWKVWIDGKFLDAGPARAAHGHARVDVIPLLLDYRDGAVHRIAIEVNGENHPSQGNTGESSFIYATVEADGKELVGTDANTPAFRMLQRREKVEAYSHARNFNEIYDLDDDYYIWRTSEKHTMECFPVEEYKEPVTLISRELPYPCMELYSNGHVMTISDIETDENMKVPLFSYETEESLKEVKEHPSIEGTRDIKRPFTGTLIYPQDSIVSVSTNHMVAIDWVFDKAMAGFCGCHFTVDEASVVDILHTSLYDGKFYCRRPDGCNDVIRLYCPAGTYNFESFLPYFTKYVRITLRKGNKLTLHKCFVREYQYDKKHQGFFKCDDALLNRVYEASIDTFRASTVDVFMDCPDRERAGWLCDSLWSARAEKYLFGDTSVNRAMIQNYAHRWEHFQEEPGFPFCYPSGADARMPTWSLFFILQLEEYLQLSGDKELVDELREHVCAFLDSLSNYENKEGLLENVKGWIFVDWSCANDAYHQQPISVAVNAMYAAGLLSASRLYDMPKLAEKGRNVQACLRGNGIPVDVREADAFFSDVLERSESGQLDAKSIYSEACQYYCYWTGVETPQSTPELFERVVDEYGVCPRKLSTNAYMTPSEIFIALLIRLDMLSKWGYYEHLKEEIKYIFGYMLDHGPGTFWETKGGNASLCHGFTSHAGVWLVRDFLGIHSIDEQGREIVIAPHPEGMRWANGSVKTKNGPVFLEWRTDLMHVWLNVSVPEGYHIKWQFPTEWKSRPEWFINGKAITENKL